MSYRIASLFAALLILTLSGSYAAADVTMVWSNLKGGSTMTVEFVDNKNMRITMGPENALFVLKGKQYMASKRRGEWRVIDMAAMRAQMAEMRKRMAEMMKQRGGEMPPGMMAGMGLPQKDSAPRNITLNPTGKKESVAGVRGELYQVVDNSPGKEGRTYHVTLTGDKRMVTAWRGWREALQSLGSGPRQASNPAMMNMMGGLEKVKGMRLAPIRVEGEMELLSINDASVPPSRLKLPAKPSAMPSMPERLGR